METTKHPISVRTDFEFCGCLKKQNSSYAVDVDCMAKAQLSPATVGFEMAKMDSSRKEGLGDDGRPGNAKDTLPGGHEESSGGRWNVPRTVRTGRIQPNSERGSRNCGGRRQGLGLEDVEICS
mmetsp:Transcript_25723/g.101440  ORF Transcript_25723/g.101440 Transcript_25723/m.101440 type:complete len:123 (-) Transcript_25723:2070-2438(-)